MTKYFRSTSPAPGEALAAYRGALDAVAEAMSAVPADQLPAGHKLGLLIGRSSASVVLQIADPDAEPPATGWTKLNIRGMDEVVYQPRKGPQGKATRALFEPFIAPQLEDWFRAHGVPSWVIHNGMQYTCGLREIGNDVYLSWSDDAPFEGNEHFAPVKASEFHLAVEAA